MVALSNGSMKGYSQHNPHYSSYTARNPLDKLLDIDAGITARILWFTIPLIDFDFDLRTNGDGKIFEYGLSFFKMKIKLWWFGLGIVYNSIPWFYDVSYTDVEPYCTKPGGNLLGFLGAPFGTSTSSSSVNWFILSYYKFNSGTGCDYTNAHIGFKGLASLHLNFSACSDGFGFTLVPLQSALDMTPGAYQHNEDFTAYSANDLMNNTPFDVIIGTDTASNAKFANRDHLYVRNKESMLKPYATCDTVAKEIIHSFVLNREIGDDTLFVNNFTLPWQTKLTAEWVILANHFNPNYKYPTLSFSQTPFNAHYSREDIFDIVGSGEAIFITDVSGGGDFDYQSPQGNHMLVDQPVYICCTRYTSRPLLQSEGPGVIPSKYTNVVQQLSVRPVPASKEGPVIILVPEKFNAIQTDILDISGKRIGSFIVQPGANVFQPQSFGMSAGMYFLVSHSPGGTSVNKIIIQ
jgi:hypothetical protein